MLDELKRFRRRPILPGWDRHIDENQLSAVREILRSALDEVIALGRRMELEMAEEILAQAIEQLNELNTEEPFIFTIEREELCDWLYELGDIIGLESDEEWVDEYRDW